jgi:hypothetical protein
LAGRPDRALLNVGENFPLLAAILSEHASRLYNALNE